jgi:hypothetical protein
MTGWIGPGGAEEAYDASHPPPFQGGKGKEHPRTTGSAMVAGRRPSLHPWLHTCAPIGALGFGRHAFHRFTPVVTYLRPL